MAIIKIRKGYDLPIEGAPKASIDILERPQKAGISAADFPGQKLKSLVKDGARVKAGTPVLALKEDERVILASPAGGTVSRVIIGERRAVLGVEIDVDGSEDFEIYPARAADEILSLTPDQVRHDLLRSGLWPFLRQRPYNRIADPSAHPKAIFVGAMPLDSFHPDPAVLLKGRAENFQLGLEILAKLTAGAVHLCYAAGTAEPALTGARHVQKHQISGPYPAGFPAVHIFYIDPPKEGEAVWYTGWQEVLAVGEFFATGRYPVERVISLAGPATKENARRYFRIRAGAKIGSICQGRVDTDARLVSGGVLTGRRVEENDFLGFYDGSVCALPEGGERRLMGFAAPGFDAWSASRTFFSSLLGKKAYRMNTDKNGSVRAFVQTGIYEEVCPVDLLPAQLAKAVMAEDFEEMEKHGILDCAECGLCTYVCPSKIEVASIIKSGMEALEKAGKE